jgi:hypothetical protein
LIGVAACEIKGSLHLQSGDADRDKTPRSALLVDVVLNRWFDDGIAVTDTEVAVDLLTTAANGSDCLLMGDDVFVADAIESYFHLDVEIEPGPVVAGRHVKCRMGDGDNAWLATGVQAGQQARRGKSAELRFDGGSGNDLGWLYDCQAPKLTAKMSSGDDGLDVASCRATKAYLDGNADDDLLRLSDHEFDDRDVTGWETIEQY